MAIRVSLDHCTHYQYDKLVFLSPQFVRLKPAAHSSAVIKLYSLTVEPKNYFLHWQQDPFGNFVARVDFTGPIQSMTIQVQIVAQLEPINPFDFFVDSYAELFPFNYDAQLKKYLAPYLEITTYEPSLIQWLGNIDRTRNSTVDFLIGLNQQLYQSITYSERLLPGVQTPSETLTLAVGSCRDSGWLLVQLLRHLGLAARFVSGYLAQVTEDDKTTDPSIKPIVNSLALHAWAEVYLPGAGWIGLDPTSGLLATEGHIPLACTPDPTGAAPVTGTSDPSQTTLTFTNTLIRLN